MQVGDYVQSVPGAFAGRIIKGTVAEMIGIVKVRIIADSANRARVGHYAYGSEKQWELSSHADDTVDTKDVADYYEAIVGFGGTL